jgi:hypothetical protein
METCKICNNEFKNLKSLSSHLNISHNILTKDYYNKFLKKHDEGVCTVCGNETSYRNMNTGYLTNCSIECRNKNKTIKRDYWKGKTQTDEMIMKRVKNTNQVEKQKKLETTISERYGVKNISKLDSIKEKISVGNKGKTSNRSQKWQQNIIQSKRNNGTLKHNDKTKGKIRDKLNEYHKLNLDREKYISESNNVNHFCGWYNGLYFRSSLELSFLVNNDEKKFTTCEKNKYKIIYKKDDKEKSYYPDFTDDLFIYEIKPSTLLFYKDNQIKINKGIEVYGDKFKIITEKESPYITKNKIFELIDSNIIVVTEKSLEKLKKYKH